MIRVHFPLRNGVKPQVGLAAALHIGGCERAHGGSGPEYSKYDKLNEEAPKAFEAASDWDSADVVVYPYRAETSPQTEAVANEARRRNIGCIFMSWGDADEVVTVPYGTVYRHSLFADRRRPFEQAMPAEVSDPQSEMGMIVWPREKQAVPKIGFCGFVSNPVMRTIYRLSGRKRKAQGLVLRARAMRALKRTAGLETQFIARQSYWAGTRSRFHHNVAGEFRPRAAFWNSVLNTDYTLCVRGAGNFSYRFYEVLAAGRIPLFVNTRCVLPFDGEIDWRKHCCWVEESQIDSIGEIVKEFHSRLSPQEFRELQVANRRLWETRLEPSRFYRQALARAVTRQTAPWNAELELAAAS